MAGKYGTFLGDFLSAAGEAFGFEWPLEHSEAWRKKQLSHRQRRKYYNVVATAKRKGFIKEVIKSGQ